MKKIFPLIALLFLAVGCAYGQSTTVSGTVTDANGQAFANGTYRIEFDPNGVAPPYQWNGSPFTPGSHIFTGVLNSSGAFSGISVPSNTSIAPNTQWKFTVCPQATAPCYTKSILITGASQSVTANLTPPAILVPSNTYNQPTAYSDSEIGSPVIGFTYFNLTDQLNHTCTVAIPCTWVTGGGGGGGGTVTNVSGTSPIAVATGTTTPVVSCPTCNTSAATVTNVSGTSPISVATGTTTPVVSCPTCTTGSVPQVPTTNVTWDVFLRSGGTLGASWTNYLNGWVPNNGGSHGTAAGGGTAFNVTAFTGISSVPTQTVTTVISSLTTDNIGPALRINGTPATTSNFYACHENASAMNISRVIGATPTTVGVQTVLATTSITGVNGDVVKCSIVGATITAYINGVLTLQVNDATPITTGLPGMFQYGDTDTISSFTFITPVAPGSCNLNIVADGDSQTVGYGRPSPYTDSLVVTNHTIPCVANLGVPAKGLGVTEAAKDAGNIESMLTTGTSVVDTLFVGGIENVVVVWGCTNDIAGGRTPAQCYTDTQSYVTARHSAGWKVVIVPAMSRTPASDDVQMQAFDALLLSGTGADAVANLPQALIGTGAFTSTVMFQSDHLHPTQLPTTTLISQGISSAINSLH